MTDIFDYCQQELDDDQESVGKVNKQEINGELNFGIEKVESAYPVPKKEFSNLGLPPSLNNKNPSAPDANKLNE